mmetsp:Transcript_40689/g.82105  ORF Transcript_40689/g.82105 Transcript_40689/m.82105 type:complete len:220 (-) Transcript_40689:1000-1659(-)
MKRPACGWKSCSDNKLQNSLATPPASRAGSPLNLNLHTLRHSEGLRGTASRAVVRKSFRSTVMVTWPWSQGTRSTASLSSSCCRRHAPLRDLGCRAVCLPFLLNGLPEPPACSLLPRAPLPRPASCLCSKASWSEVLGTSPRNVGTRTVSKWPGVPPGTKPHPCGKSGGRVTRAVACVSLVRSLVMGTGISITCPALVFEGTAALISRYDPEPSSVSSL